MSHVLKIPLLFVCVKPIAIIRKPSLISLSSIFPFHCSSICKLPNADIICVFDVIFSNSTIVHLHSKTLYVEFRAGKINWNLSVFFFSFHFLQMYLTAKVWIIIICYKARKRIELVWFGYLLLILYIKTIIFIHRIWWNIFFVFDTRHLHNFKRMKFLSEFLLTSILSHVKYVLRFTFYNNNMDLSIDKMWIERKIRELNIVHMNVIVFIKNKQNFEVIEEIRVECIAYIKIEVKNSENKFQH